ncbi:hypothetical protein AKJ16_DCAP26026, partial [Drosera capensis]
MRPNVMTISRTRAFQQPMPEERESAEVDCKSKSTTSNANTLVFVEECGLTEGHSRAFSGKDEDDHGNELSQGSLECSDLTDLRVVTNGDSGDRHCQGVRGL